MFEVVKFKKSHLDQMEIQPEARHMMSLSFEDLTRLENDRFSMTGIGDGRVVVCAGVIEHWPGRGEAWFVFDMNSRDYFINIHKCTKRFVELCPVKRIEAVVNCDFEAGHRWVKIFGFQLEAERMKNYGVNGEDCSLYSLVKGDEWSG